MRDFIKKIKQIHHCNIIPLDFPKWVFLEQPETVFDKFPNGNGAPDTME